MIDEILYANGDINEPCRPDLTKRVCFGCRRNIRARLAILAHNLAVGAALEEAWILGSVGCPVWPAAEPIDPAARDNQW